MDTQKLEEHFLGAFAEFGEQKIRNFYNSYKMYYKSNSIDFEDLKQDMTVLCWETLTGKKWIDPEEEENKGKNFKVISAPKLKDKEEVKKYISGFLRRALGYTLRDSPTLEKNYLGILFFAELDEYGDYKDTEPLDILKNIKKKLDQDEVLGNKAYKLLYAKFINNKTETQIAKELHLLKDRVVSADATKREFNRLIKVYGNKKNLYKPIVMVDLEHAPEQAVESNQSVDFLLAEIRSVVKPRDYNIIYEKVIEGQTFRQIAENREMSPEGVRKIYNSAMALVKKSF